MATKTKTTGKAAKTFDEALEAIGKLPPNSQYPSGAALLEAAAPGTAGSIGTRVRQIMRDHNDKVGRGKRYVNITPRVLLNAHKENQAVKAQAKAAVKAAKAKPAKKATTKKVEAQEPVAA